MFVRFRGVQDIKGLEKQLNDVIYKGRVLKANLSLYGRKEKPHAKSASWRHTQPANKHSLRTGMRDQRTFVEVTRPDERAGIVPPSTTLPPTLPPQPSILLHQELENYH